MKMTAENLFCVKHLSDQGITPEKFGEMIGLLDRFDVSEYAIVKLGKDSFFEELAKQLRVLWPPGEKDGKYPWRDSVKNTVVRLKALWKDRNLEGHTIEECTMAARRYIAQFDDDKKFMLLMKYFIWKQKELTHDDGRKTYVTESKLADMLEGKAEIDAELDSMMGEEWEQLINESEGRLI